MRLGISRWMAVSHSATSRTLGNLRLARVDWDGALWEAVAAQLTVEQGRLTIDDASARTLGGWIRLRPETFIDLQGPRRDFHVHLAAEQLDLQLRDREADAAVGPSAPDLPA